MKTNHYKITLALTVFLLGALACSTEAFPAPQPTAAPTLSPTAAQPISQSVILTSTPFSEENKTPLYKITAQIPTLTGSDDPRALAFNAELKDIVQQKIDAFKKDTLVYTTSPIVSGGSFFNIQYELVGQQGNFWSIKFNMDGYTDGAAHPYHFSTTVNYDLDKGKDVTLDEIFLPNSNYLQFISQYCVAELNKRDIGFDGFHQGADPTAENYRNWNASNDGIMITFDEYQVAPYAAGPQTVTIPYSVLGSLMNNQSPLTPFVP
jgi:hypothetical protein